MVEESEFCEPCDLPDDLAGEKNSENYWVDADEDDPNSTRWIHGIAECIRPEECSANSWAKFKPWSLISKKQCCSYLKHHLMVSGKHQMSAADADAAILTAWSDNAIAFTEESDTFNVRQQYREMVWQSRKQQQSFQTSSMEGSAPIKKAKIIKSEPSSSRGEASSSRGEGTDQQALQVQQKAMLENFSSTMQTVMRHLIVKVSIFR